ncbi:DUF6609 family protein [Bacillus sp. REN16]|uniref:DUF6609 family protein n=1 Tax=Bacillus sp. REN16 TaxID=2887296 RepID=UPI001E5CA8A7|nr:DUF6609 family protein [Bacillus sp. REN16]MCC3359490.1 hypothetical protein [Bacillus sp. REN16]
MSVISGILNGLGYVKGQPLTFFSKRVCGLWLIWVSAVILIGTIFGGTQKINMPIFDVGYFLGFALILLNKRVYRRLAFGSHSKFQKNMTNASIVLMFILLVGIGGPFFASHNYRMIWLGAFLAIGIHFIPFATVHGKIMLPLAFLTSVNAIIGMLFPTVNFAVFAFVDVGIKVLFGIILLFSKNPLLLNNVDSQTPSV